MATELEAATALAVLDPLRWAKRWTPKAVPLPYAPHHADLCRLPEPGRGQWRVVWRGSAKTTLLRSWLLWLCERGKVRGIVWARANGSDNRADYRNTVATCKLRGLPYSYDGQERVLVVRGVPIWFRTPGGAVRGIQWVNPATGEVVRPDLLIADDLETRETARSGVQTETLRAWLMSDAMQTGEQSHPLRAVLMGTPITPTSLCAQGMRQEPPFEQFDPPMIVPLFNDAHVPAWPAMHELDPLLEERTDDDTWATEYLLEPLPVGSLVFPPSRTRWVPDVDMPRMTCRIGVDPATGDGKDRTGIVAAGLAPGGLHIPAAVCWHGDGDDVPDQVVAMIDDLERAGHRVDGVAVEAVGGFRFVARRTAEKVYPIATSHGKPRDGKLVRAQDLNRWHKVGAVTFAESLRGSPLDVETHSWNRSGQTLTGHDDMPDALVWAARTATDGWSVQPPALPLGIRGLSPVEQGQGQRSR